MNARRFAPALAAVAALLLALPAAAQDLWLHVKVH